MKINELFYSLQGEGHFAGTPALFIRFSGCNLQCSFCDTHHQSFTEWSEEQIVSAVAQSPARHVVLTGGEPTLQLTASLCQKLHQHGKFIQIETNGTHPIPQGCQLDWITCSPKTELFSYATVQLTHIDELKVVFTGNNDMHCYNNLQAQCYSLQPCDTGCAEKNQTLVKLAVDYCLNHPKWSLSLQTHKLLNIR